MRAAFVGLVVAAAAAFVIVTGLDTAKPGGIPAHDVYNYFYPNMLHALQSLASGGAGLFWDPFQNCGQPFAAVSSVGLFYPLNVFFLFFSFPIALRAVLFANLVIGGLGTYALGRTIRLSAAAAIAGALAFILCPSMLHMTTWMPTVQGPYVWMPVAMWCCERLIRSPGLRPTLLLGVALGIGLLPGHPQFVLFTCELIALRLVWSAFDGTERAHLPRAVAGVGVALVVMLLIAAVQLFPSMEVASESLRSNSLHRKEISPNPLPMTWIAIATNVIQHSAMAPFAPIPGCIALAALVGAARRRAALFYFLAGVLFLVISFGFDSIVGRFYYALPFAHLFRIPLRFSFVAAFCFAVLTGLAVDALAAGAWRGLLVAAAALATLYLAVGLHSVDWVLAVPFAVAGLLAVAAPRARPAIGVALLAAVAATGVVAPPWSIQRYLDRDPLRAHADLLEPLARRLTPHDRVHIITPANDPGFQHKTAGVFGLRAISDLEPQMTRRYAEYFTMLQKGRPLKSVNQLYHPGEWSAAVVRWPLVDLAGVRYLLIARNLEGSLSGVPPGRLIADGGDEGVAVYVNPSALPRAYYVPQIAVLPDPQQRLQHLASGRDDRRRMALVAAPPATGFEGVPGNSATGDAHFAVDQPERVVVELTAPERGFLFLADQYFPGWTALVNGQAAPIQIANHAFRLVEVPKGPVTVEFAYHPRRFWIGALVSAASALTLVAAMMSMRRRARRAGVPVALHPNRLA